MVISGIHQTVQVAAHAQWLYIYFARRKTNLSSLATESANNARIAAIKWRSSGGKLIVKQRQRPVTPLSAPTIESQSTDNLSRRVSTSSVTARSRRYAKIESDRATTSYSIGVHQSKAHWKDRQADSPGNKAEF